MAGYNTKHVQRSTQIKRVWNGHTVTPTRYYSSTSKGIMCGNIDGELVRDSEGAVVPWSHIPYSTVE